MKQEITYEDYNKVEIKVGTVLKVSKNEKARKPSLVVEVDFGGKLVLKNLQLKLLIITMNKIWLESKSLEFVIFQKKI